MHNPNCYKSGHAKKAPAGFKGIKGNNEQSILSIIIKINRIIESTSKASVQSLLFVFRSPLRAILYGYDDDHVQRVGRRSCRRHFPSCERMRICSWQKRRMPRWKRIYNTNSTITLPSALNLWCLFKE